MSADDEIVKLEERTIKIIMARTGMTRAQVENTLQVTTILFQDFLKGLKKVEMS